MTEMATTRGLVLQLSCCDGFGLGRGFLGRDRTFLVVKEDRQDWGLLCCDKAVRARQRCSVVTDFILCRDRG